MRWAHWSKKSKMSSLSWSLTRRVLTYRAPEDNKNIRREANRAGSHRNGGTTGECLQSGHGSGYWI